MSDETYSIVRMSFKDGRRTIETGLTLDEARQHCNDPETSSRTCSPEVELAETMAGPWFDGYEKE